MPEDEFELYLTLLAKTLRLKDAQRESIAAELRDHMEQRLEELTAQGHGRQEAIRLALAEFGDASGLANDLTKTNPVRIRTRRHLMQTTFGTVLACAAVTFLVMTLTPTNKDGRPTQPGAVAQEGDGFGDFDGGADEAAGGFSEFGGEAGGGEFGSRGAGGFDFGGEMRGGMATSRFATAQAVKLDLSIHVVDCTEILRPDRGRGDLLERTAALAAAVQNTVANVTDHGRSAISVQPFEEFLIITATDPAYDEAQMLLDQIGEHVARRAAVEEERAREMELVERRRMEQAETERRVLRERQLELQAEYDRVSLASSRLQEQSQRLAAQHEELRQQRGPDHAEVQPVLERLREMEAERNEIEEHKLQLRIQIEQLQRQAEQLQLQGF